LLEAIKTQGQHLITFKSGNIDSDMAEAGPISIGIDFIVDKAKSNGELYVPTVASLVFPIVDKVTDTVSPLVKGVDTHVISAKETIYTAKDKANANIKYYTNTVNKKCADSKKFLTKKYNNIEHVCELPKKAYEQISLDNAKAVYTSTSSKITDLGGEKLAVVKSKGFQAYAFVENSSPVQFVQQIWSMILAVITLLYSSKDVLEKVERIDALQEPIKVHGDKIRKLETQMKEQTVNGDLYRAGDKKNRR